MNPNPLQDVIEGILAPRPVGGGQEGALSTGSTLLNLACADSAQAGLLPGGYYYLVGDSMSGKTWLTFSIFAEACLNPFFKRHRLIHDDVEGGAMMDIGYFFGKEVKRRVEAPGRDRRERPICSTTVESFYYHLHDACKDKRPFIYVLDSQDALTSSASGEKFDKQREASVRGTEVAGSYGDGKAKFHSEHLRLMLSKIRKRGSILIIIGQTRDNLGFGFEKKTRSGGKALRFYANLEIWTSVEGKIRRTVRGKSRTIGVRCLAEVRKNRFTGKTGKDRAVCIPIYYSMGIDDVGSLVDFLIEEKHWRGNKKGQEDKEDAGRSFDAADILFKGTRNEIVRYIEDEGLEGKVRKVAGAVWAQIEAECAVARKRRYT